MATPSDVVIKEGNLVKRSRGRYLSAVTRWQLRRLTLTADQLKYADVGGAVKGSFPLNATTTVQQRAVDGKDFPFVVATNDEEFFLNGANDEDRSEWIDAIQSAVRKLHQGANEPSASVAAPAAPPSGDVQKAAAEREQRAREELQQLNTTQQESRELLLREQQAAAASRAAKQALLQKLSAPCECEKKLSTETSFHPRHIWVNPETKEFHWAKSADDAGKSKCININTNILTVTAGPEGEPAPSFEIQLTGVANLPPSVFGSSSLFSPSKAAPASGPVSIDIRFSGDSEESRKLRDGFVWYLSSKGAPV